MRINPVLEREVRERMRGTRSVVVLTIYLVLLIGIFFLVYSALTGSSSGSSTVAPTEVARLGRSIFEYVLFFMLLLVIFLVPGFTSAAVAGERERQTLIPMQITLLRPRDLTGEQLRLSGIGDGTIRLSIGVEDVEDLLADLAEALKKT